MTLYWAGCVTHIRLRIPIFIMSHISPFCDMLLHCDIGLCVQMFRSTLLHMFRMSHISLLCDMITHMGLYFPMFRMSHISLLCDMILGWLCHSYRTLYSNIYNVAYFSPLWHVTSLCRLYWTLCSNVQVTFTPLYTVIPPCLLEWWRSRCVWGWKLV